MVAERTPRGAALLLLAAAGLVLLAPLAAAAEPATQQVNLYLRRDGALDAAPPAGGDAAAWVFGTAGADEARFRSAALPEPWVLRAPATLTFTLALQVGLTGGVAAILDAGGNAIAASTAPGPLAPGVQEVAITFRDFRATIPAGQRIGVTLLAAPAVDLGAAGVGLGQDPDGAPAAPGTLGVDLGGLTAPLGLGGAGDPLNLDLGGTVDGVTTGLGLPALGLGGLLGSLGLPGVTIAPQVPDVGALPDALPIDPEGTLVGVVVYDAATHPARLSLTRELPTPAPPATPPPAAGPDPDPDGPRSGPLPDPDPDGSGAGPAPLQPVGDGPGLEGLGGGFDLFTVLLGAGTAAIAALSGLALHGRNVLG